MEAVLQSLIGTLVIPWWNHIGQLYECFWFFFSFFWLCYQKSSRSFKKRSFCLVLAFVDWIWLKQEFGSKFINMVFIWMYPPKNKLFPLKRGTASKGKVVFRNLTTTFRGLYVTTFRECTLNKLWIPWLHWPTGGDRLRRSKACESRWPLGNANR